MCSWKSKIQYLKILEYLLLRFNKWSPLQYTFLVFLILWSHNKWGRLLTWQWSRIQSLTPSTKRVSHRGSLLKCVALHRVLYQSILHAKLTGRNKLDRKSCTSNRDDHESESTVKQSRFKHLGELHKEWTEPGVSASRVTMLRCLQEKGY